MIETPQPPIIQTFTCHMEHIAKLSELKQRLGINKSEIIRRSINEFYARNQEQPQAEKENAAE